VQLNQGRKLHTTYRFRIKDSNCQGRLRTLAGEVNLVWNFVNEVTRRRWKESRKHICLKDLQVLTKGSTSLLRVNAQTIRAVQEELLIKLKAGKRLRFRSGRKNLGWVPFKSQTSKFLGDHVTYAGSKFRFWLDRPLPDGAIFRYGSFSEDARGHWYVNIVCEVSTTPVLDRPVAGTSVGIDPGVKTIITTSNGEKFERPSLTAKHSVRLAKAQRRHKKRQVNRINAKIRNSRRDFNHKASLKLAQNYGAIFFGDASPSRLSKTRMAKGVQDASWYQIKQFCRYKTIRRGGTFVEVNEKNSTVTCSVCLNKTGPSGLSGLRVREWICSVCGAVHDRDINAAKNILRLGHETLRVNVKTRGSPTGGRCHVPTTGG